MFEILTSPRPDDRFARIVNVSLLVLIAANVIASILETDAELSARAPEAFRWFEIGSIAVFTVEYLLRLWSATASDAFQGALRGRLLYATRPMSLIDFVSIAPFYVELFLPSILDLRFLRVLRLVRLFRLFRIGPVSRGFSRLISIIQAKRIELLISMSVVLVAIVLAAGAIYFVEHDEPNSQFTSIPRAMWWSVVTITTVGYGDMYPVTAIGKALGGLVAVVGICAVALPVGIISSGYMEELANSREEENADDEPHETHETAASTCPHCGGSLPSG